MPIAITVPRLGWSMEEGTFAGWLRTPGEFVQPGEPLFSFESEKVTMEVEALDAGHLYFTEGEPTTGAILKPGEVIGYLLAAGEPPPAQQPADEEPAVTPRARRVAAELGVDTGSLQGTGAGGRIRERDVLAAAPAEPAKAAVPVTGIRRTIANRMSDSRSQTVPVTLTRRVDASRLTALRNRWKLALQPGPAPSFNDIIAKAAAAALAAHPMLGGRWEDDQIVLPQKIHIGIAVDTSHGLQVPVLRDVLDTPLEELALRSRQLAEAARNRQLQAHDITGAVFTISNLGSYGVEAFTPIINPPETAVLGLGAIRWEPVVLTNGQIVAREQMMLSLTFDHRVVDGAPAARFLAAVAAFIEEPPASVHCA